jgi:signal recognition particle receptor subunit beta
MSFIDYMAREINCKLVYHGPGLGGKTSNLQYVYSRTAPEAKTKLISLATETERTLSFSFVPQSFGDFRGLKFRFHLYTVPGPVFYDVSRQLIFKGVDGVVFVADTQSARFEANVESLENLESILALHGLVVDRVPLVFQWNKRDLPEVTPVDELEAALNPGKRPSFAASAATGVGVFDTLKAACKLVIAGLRM